MATICRDAEYRPASQGERAVYECVCECAGLFAFAVVFDYRLLSTSLSTQQMRSGFAIPKSMRGFPALLRAQGFYTSNNVKTDYNTGNYADIIKASWNESSATAHWRKRGDKAQPFFSVFNLMTSHQSRSMVALTRFRKEVQSTLPPGAIHDPARCRYRALSGHHSSAASWRASTIA